MERPSSIWSGNDSDLLKWAIPFYWRKGGSPRILDATWGLGNFWRGWDKEILGAVPSVSIVAIDIDPRGSPDLVADNRQMPFRDNSFDVVIYDPPHMHEVGTPKSSEISRGFKKSYGVVAPGDMVFHDFLSEAARVLRTEGILLTKLSDEVHSGHNIWNHVNFINEAGKTFRVCDMIIKTRKSAIMGHWVQVLHARKHHSFWIIARKGTHC